MGTEMLMFSLALTALNVVYSLCHAYVKRANNARGAEEAPKPVTHGEKNLTMLSQNLVELQKEMIQT